MQDVEFYGLYNGLRARDMMPCLCREFAVFFTIFWGDFLLSLCICYEWSAGVSTSLAISASFLQWTED